MSADVDPEDQTEEPTEKRLHDATERGEVAFSREAPLFASLSATLIALIFVIPGRAGRPPFGARRPHRRSRRLAHRARRRHPCSRRPARRRQRALPFADGDPADRRRRSRVRRSERAPHRARANHARPLAHLAAQRPSPAVGRPRLDRIPEEPDQARGGDRGRDDDAGRPEGRPAHGDGRRSGHAAAARARPLRQNDRRRASRDVWPWPPPTSPGRGFSGGAITA